MTSDRIVWIVDWLMAWPLRNEFPAFWEFLGILNSQKFPTMQISLHQISLEFLRIFGNGKLGLTLGLEFLGILSFTILEA